MSVDAQGEIDDPTEQVIRSSRAYWLAYAVGWGAFGVTYGIMLHDTWWNREHPIMRFRLDLALSALGFLAVPASLLLMAGCLYRFAFPYFLGIGAERLRVVRPGLFGPVVLLSIPYANMAGVNYEGSGMFPRLEINLIDPEDAGTSSRGGFGVDIDSKGEKRGDFCLKDCYQTGLDEVGRLVVERWRRGRSGPERDLTPGATG